MHQQPASIISSHLVHLQQAYCRDGRVFFCVWMFCFVSLSCWLQDKRVADILYFKCFRDLFRTSWNKSLSALNGFCSRNASDSSVKGHCYTCAATKMPLSAVWDPVFFFFFFTTFILDMSTFGALLKSWRAGDAFAFFCFTTGHFWNCRPVLLLCAQTLLMWTHVDSVRKH